MTRAITTKRVPCTETLPSGVRVSCEGLPTRRYSDGTLDAAQEHDEPRNATALRKYLNEETDASWRKGAKWVAGDLNTTDCVWTDANCAYYVLTE